jgi:hypothetical protein
VKYSTHLRLTLKQRKELERRAKAESRLLANYVAAVIVRELHKG